MYNTYDIMKLYYVNTAIWLADKPEATLVILDNMGWYCDVANKLIRQQQIQIVVK
jgi:hypothetical protein